ncbi:MAG TPA: LuxR C-terminal-related transcriptional regulator [Polyangiaceae bacterium]|jgi:DNA-binding CsgD family transcriptional regulator
MRRGKDLLAIVDAAYTLEGTHQEWLDRLASVTNANIPFRRTLGVVANAYDISDRRRPDLVRDGVAWATDDVDGLKTRWTKLVDFYSKDPERTAAGYGALDEGLGLDIPADGRERLAGVLRDLDMGDVYGVNARNPSGQGCLLRVYLPKRFEPLAPAQRRTIARIARHVAAAYRLRSRLEPDAAVGIDDADAVVKPNGDVAHAVGAARTSEAREELRRAAVRLALVRGRTRFEDPEAAMAHWKALVDARWSLVDHFERDGTRFLVARRNDCQPASIALLTQRERQVVALAAMGQSNKAIAYDLGVATSTVGVLVSRALRRLGLRSRRDLARVVARRKPPA